MSRFFKGGSSDSDSESESSSEESSVYSSSSAENSSSEESSSDDSETESESSESSESSSSESESESSDSESESESESDSSEASDSEGESSESESESESEQESEEEESSEDEEERPKGPAGFLKTTAKPDESKSAASKFLRGGESSDESSDEEDGRRVVKSARDKRLEELDTCIQTIDSSSKSNKWVVVSNEFDHLNKISQKCAQAGQRPPKYIELISKLDELLESADKAFVKKLDAANARAFNTLKQRVRKNNRQFAREIERYRQDPVAFLKPVEIADVVKTSNAKAGQDEIIVDGVATRGIVAPVATDGLGKADEIKPADIFKHLRTIYEARGKKSTDRAEQIRILEKLASVAVTDYQRLRVKVALISARFDLSPSGQYMPVEQWNFALKELIEMLDVMDKNRKIVVVEDIEDDFEDDDNVAANAVDGVLRVQGSMISFLERLDDEFTRSLQMIDPHSPEYIERLKNETDLYKLIVKTQSYLERINVVNNTARLIMRRLDRLYYKTEQVIRANEEAAWSSFPATFDLTITPRALTSTPDDLIHALCVYLYKNGTSLLRTRAMLCHIYHEALQNRFYKARDMLLMSHLQDTVHAADIATQILHNRTMVQIGFCAFRNGMVQEAQSALQDVSTTGRVKELLGQGIQTPKFGQAAPEPDRLDRQLVLPFHMHINLELLECVYLTCSMLMEIPAMAAALSAASDARKKVISRPFRRMLEYNDRQSFTGPPENTREFIMQASKALSDGDWRRCEEFIHSIKIWNLMADTESIKSMLSEKIREEGLRTYLLTYAAFYDSMSLSFLAETFDLPLERITVIISRLLSKREIHAALDEVHGAVVFERVELNRLEILAIQLSEKVAQLGEANEKVYEQKTQHNNPQDNRRRDKGGAVKRRNDRGGNNDNRGNRSEAN
ncbi:translation initiation factor eIF3c [Schizosaccharomyces japonicus yFS275]|uniref:Eukaryotic translation initiation factor 3 subunit C n=1 Tax=Schizosaccharomyces japonicus (strain yFS275 / FY16936) TaxID=402676 RepID=B6K8A3_SCHJY|nr:translation initiation factor eIF3c [Schizosaccharomyces japonicus yFS275]EEB09757.1 translation initiation factor eIF3c [Schizosaccharomyces japonicus yFS275]